MIIIDSQYYQVTPLTAFVFAGNTPVSAFIIGPDLIRTTSLPELSPDGFWLVSTPGIQQISTLKINGKLYFESQSILGIQPGQFILDTNNALLTIKPYD